MDILKTFFITAFILALGTLVSYGGIIRLIILFDDENPERRKTRKIFGTVTLLVLFYGAMAYLWFAFMQENTSYFNPYQ